MRPNEYQRPATPLVTQDGQLQVKLGAPWYLQTQQTDRIEGAELLKQQLATSDDSFMMGIINHAVEVAGGAKADDASVNTVFAIIRAVQPRNELETLLAMQMAATHFALVGVSSLLVKGSDPDGLPMPPDPSLVTAATNAIAKLGHTFASQNSLLNRERKRERDCQYIELKEPINLDW